jgi:hypothetical protein
MRKNDHKTYINNLGVPLSYSHGYFGSFFIELNTLASGTMTFGAQPSESGTNFPNYKGAGPQIQMNRKITDYYVYRTQLYICSMSLSCIYHQRDFPIHLYLGPCSLIIGKISA